MSTVDKAERSLQINFRIQICSELIKISTFYNSEIYNSLFNENKVFDFIIKEQSIRKSIQSNSEHTVTMLINIKTLAGRIIPIELEPSTTIDETRQAITDKEGIAKDHIRLIHGGKSLENHKTLCKYDIKNEDTVYLVTRLRS